MIFFKNSPLIDVEQKDFIFSKRPFLNVLSKKYGDMPIKQYVLEHFKNIRIRNTLRQTELIECVENLVSQRLGESVSKELAEQLKKYYWASSADHHNILNTNLPLSSNLLFDKALEHKGCILVLSCASISQNNEDFPRGVLFHRDGETQHAAFFPSKNRNSIVYGFRPFTEKEANAVSNELSTFPAFARLLQSEDVLNSNSFCTQVTKINYKFWNLLFPQTKSHLIYLEFEELVTQLLIKHHLGGSGVIYNLIFDSKNEAILSRLIRVMEQSMRQGNAAAEIFWGISDEKKYRIPLKKINGFLKSDDSSFCIKFTPSAILTALKEKKIMPTMFLVFLVLNLYYGLNCFGGINQTQYLTELQTEYDKLEIDNVKSSSDIFLYNYGLSFIYNSNGGDTYALDLLNDENNNLWNDMQLALNETTFNDALSGAFPLYYSLLS